MSYEGNGTHLFPLKATSPKKLAYNTKQNQHFATSIKLYIVHFISGPREETDSL
jgi:hypothetical protein